FNYDQDERRKLRTKYGVTNEKLYGHVGRNSYAKNHKFLFDTFKEILSKESRSKLLLVGVDKQAVELVNYAKKIGIINNIIFAGYQNDVSGFYSAMDVLIFPSIYEGFPGTLVESQVSGLQSYCSDSITEEVLLTKNIKFL